MGADKKFKGLTKEMRARLKKLIMKRAKEELQNEAKRKLEARNNYIKERVPAIDGVEDEAGLKKLAASLQKTLLAVEYERYDIEEKMAKNQEELNKLNAKLNDKPGVFMKPVLKRTAKKLR